MKIEIRNNDGESKLAKKNSCCWCHKPIRTKKYKVCITQKPMAFYYSHINCGNKP